VNSLKLSKGKHRLLGMADFSVPRIMLHSLIFIGLLVIIREKHTISLHIITIIQFVLSR
jgi:hypothetical protein